MYYDFFFQEAIVVVFDRSSSMGSFSFTADDDGDDDDMGGNDEYVPKVIELPCTQRVHVNRSRYLVSFSKHFCGY